ncbi:Amino-oxidase domain-containing protein [Aphelenchoides besseyi]|nr:Amino-oxidase domain-containing protein [Aphelenchoides besseyi]
MKMTRSELVILGCGPTALGALERFNQLKKDNYISSHSRVLIIERESEPGGLARSIVDKNGFVWDLGVHVTGNSRFPAFVEMLKETIPNWNKIKRCIKVQCEVVLADISHVASDPNNTFYIPYPVQNSIHHFPPELRNQCLRELAELETNSSTAKVNENFGEFTRRQFGSTLQSIFIRPYNEKVWTVPMEEMCSTWAEGRVPKINFEQLQRTSETPLEDRTDISAFRYPADSKGMGELWQRFASKFSDSFFMFNSEVVGINLDDKTLSVRNVKNGEQTEISNIFDLRLLLSTIPVLELNRICGLFSDLNLRFSTVLLVGVGLHKPQNKLASELSWAYYPRSEIVFYRCTVISNFSNSLTPDPEKFWSVLCEIGRRPTDEIEPSERIVERVIQDLKRVQLIESEDQVHSTWFNLIPYGYPIPSLSRDSELEKLNEKLEEHQIFSRGRFGGWKYELSNQDYCFEMGRQAVARLYLDVDEQLA